MPKAKGSLQFAPEKQQMQDLIQQALPHEPTDDEINKMYEEFYKLHPEANPATAKEYVYSPEEANVLYESYMARDPRENILAYAFTPSAMARLLPAESTMTQRHFRYSDLDRMRDIYEHQRKAYYAGMAPQEQSFVRNAPQVPVDRFLPYEEYTQASFVPPVQSPATPLTRARAMFDQEYRIAPFVEGAYYTKAPEGTYLHNVYSGDGLREVNVLLPRSKK